MNGGRKGALSLDAVVEWARETGHKPTLTVAVLNCGDTAVILECEECNGKRIVERTPAGAGYGPLAQEIMDSDEGEELADPILLPPDFNGEA